MASRSPGADGIFRCGIVNQAELRQTVGVVWIVGGPEIILSKSEGNGETRYLIQCQSQSGQQSFSWFFRLEGKHTNLIWNTSTFTHELTRGFPKLGDILITRPVWVTLQPEGFLLVVGASAGAQLSLYSKINMTFTSPVSQCPPTLYSHPLLVLGLWGVLALSSAGRSKKAFEMANWASISSFEIPWSTRVKNPAYSAALSSCAMISSLRLSKSRNSISRLLRLQLLTVLTFEGDNRNNSFRHICSIWRLGSRS